MSRPPVVPSRPRSRRVAAARAALVLTGAFASVLLVGPARAVPGPTDPGPAHVSPTPRSDTAPEGRWPLDPRPAVVAVFRPPADPWGPGHRGVDLAGHAGQVVRSALPGTVAFAGSVAGKPVVTVDHGGRRTTYEPVVATVSVGDTVAAGAPLGRLAVLHGHCLPGACLHWGLVRSDTYLDPLSLVGGGPVRLLPLWRDDPVTASTPAWRPVLALWPPPLLHLLEHLDVGGRSAERPGT